MTNFAHAPEDREELARLIERRDDANKRMTDAKAALARLETAMAAGGKIAAELQGLDLHEARAMSVWAANNEGDAPPSPEIDKRRELETKLAGAISTGAAARTATAGPRGEVDRASAEIAAIDGQAVGLASIVALGEIEPLVDEIARESARLSTKRQMLGAGRAVAMRHVESLPFERRPRQFYVALEKVDAQIQRAISPPAPDAESEGAYASAIVSLLARLPHDAEATTL